MGGKAVAESQTESVVSSISSSLFSCWSGSASCRASGSDDSNALAASESSGSACADEQARGSTRSQQGRARQLAISVGCGDHGTDAADSEASGENSCRTKHEQLRMHERLHAIEHMPALFFMRG